MKPFDMLYKMKITEGRGLKRKTYYKYGVTNQHAEDRAKKIEKSAADNGHNQIKVKPIGYYFDRDRSIDISKAEHNIHSNKKYRHYDDGGRPFNGSTELYSAKDHRKIEKELRSKGIKFSKCGK